MAEPTAEQKLRAVQQEIAALREELGLDGTVAAASPRRSGPTVTLPDSPSSTAPSSRPKSAPRSWHELGQESPEKPFWGARPSTWQMDDCGSSDLTEALANAPTRPGSSQVWRLDGTSDGATSWGDVGVRASAWADDGQQRDQLSSNDEDSDSDDSDSDDSDSDDNDDFAGVPYVPIGDGTSQRPNALAAPFYPSNYRT